MKTAGALRAWDRKHFWHPYTNIHDHEERDFPVIERAEGVYLYDTDDHRKFDGISSWWCANLGHSNPHIVRAISEQAGKLQHSITGGMSHPQVIRLSGRIAGIAPSGLTRVYYASDGASAVEAAMRIALQYWWNVGRPEKKQFVSLEGGYHGDTIACAGLGYVQKFHEPLDHVLSRSVQACPPDCFACSYRNEEGCSLECFDSMEGIVTRNAASIAAVIVEPICQGAAGMRIYPPEYVKKLEGLCRENDVLLVLDEIAVGFGRTGRMFASELAGVAPDMMCLGKGLTGGSLPMSAVVVKEFLYDSFRSTPEKERTFSHGHTYCGNPIASAAANASLDLYLEGSVLENVAILEKEMRTAFEEFSRYPGILDATALGCMSSLRVEEAAGGARLAGEVASSAWAKGLFIRPLGPVLYLWPPLVTDRAQIIEVLDIFRDSLLENLG